VGFRAASACAMGREFNARPFSHEHSPRSSGPTCTPAASPRILLSQVPPVLIRRASTMQGTLLRHMMGTIVFFTVMASSRV
jgi:hypothetical protein